MRLLVDPDDLVESPTDHAQRYPWSVFRALPPAELDEHAGTVRRASDRLAASIDRGVGVIGLGRPLDGPGASIPIPLLGLDPGLGMRPTDRLRLCSWATHEPPAREQLDALAARGLIEHVRIETVPVSMRRLLLARADVVVDRLGWGGLGWAGLEGLLAGALVLRPPGGPAAPVEREVAVEGSLLDLDPVQPWEEVLAEARERRGSHRPDVADAVLRHHGGWAVRRALQDFVPTGPRAKTARWSPRRVLESLRPVRERSRSGSPARADSSEMNAVAPYSTG